MRGVLSCNKKILLARQYYLIHGRVGIREIQNCKLGFTNSYTNKAGLIFLNSLHPKQILLHTELYQKIAIHYINCRVVSYFKMGHNRTISAYVICNHTCFHIDCFSKYQTNAELISEVQR
jgi:hypothetical protein